MTRNQIDWQNMLISGRRQTEDARHNLATETELIRSNKRREYLNAKEIGVKADNLEEAIRHNKMSEYLDDFKNNEIKRHNQMAEAKDNLQVQLQHLDRAEANRINESFNDLNVAQRDMERIENARHNKRVEDTQVIQVSNNYRVALRNLAAELRKVGVMEDKKDSEIGLNKARTVDSYAGAFKSGTSGVKDIFQMFTMGGNLIK